MHVVGEFGQPPVGFNQTVGKFRRVARGVADAFNSVDFAHIFQKQRKVHNRAVGAAPAVRVHILPEKRDFLHALCGKKRAFHKHVHQRTADFFAARIRHHAVRAVLAAAFHDGNKGRGPVALGRRQTIKLFNFRKRDVHLRAPGFQALFNHFRQPVQCLRPEHNVHPGGALQDIFTFLACHTAAHGDEKLRILFLDFADASEIREGLFLSLFTNRTGHDHNEIGFFGRCHPLVPVFGHQVDDTGGVIVIHLAAEAAQIEFFCGHGLHPSAEKFLKADILPVSAKMLSSVEISV